MTQTTARLDRALPLARDARVSSVVWVSAFAALTFAGARIVIPTLPVPMTLQTSFVLLAGALLGPRLGALSQLVYLAVGALGAPVFAAGGGWGYFAGPTGGYLVGFPLGAWLCGLVVHARILQRNRLESRMLAGMLVGLVAIFGLGIAWLAIGHRMPLEAALAAGFGRLQLWSLVKYVTTALLAVLLLNRPHRT